jgi:hypothetical protein
MTGWSVISLCPTIFANRAFPIRRQMGRFCGDFGHSLSGFWSLEVLGLFADDSTGYRVPDTPNNTISPAIQDGAGDPQR